MERGANAWASDSEPVRTRFESEESVSHSPDDAPLCTKNLREWLGIVQPARVLVLVFRARVPGIAPLAFGTRLARVGKFRRGKTTLTRRVVVRPRMRSANESERRLANIDLRKNSVESRRLALRGVRNAFRAMRALVHRDSSRSPFPSGTRTREAEKSDEGDTHHAGERSYGSFTRAFRDPGRSLCGYHPEELERFGSSRTVVEPASTASRRSHGHR